MSLLWRDRFCISVSPGRVGLIRFARGWKPKLVRSEFVADTSASEDASGIATIKLLASMLADGKPAFGDASVVLSDAFVRYLVLPWSAEAIDNRDWEALAQHEFRVIYGDAALEWTTAVHWQGPGRAVVACAAPRVLIDGVKETLRAARLALRSLSPYFVAAFNSCRSQLPADAFWFGVVDAGRFSFGGLEEGRWASVASRRVGGDGKLLLTETLEQEVLGSDHGCEPGRVFVFSPEREVTAVETDEGWSVEPVAGDEAPALSDPRLAMALTAWV